MLNVLRAAGFGRPPVAEGVPPSHPTAINIPSSTSADAAEAPVGGGYNYPMFPYPLPPYAAPGFVFPPMVMPGPLVGEMWLPPNLMHMPYPLPGGPFNEGFNRKYSNRGGQQPGSGPYGQPSGPFRHRQGYQNGYTGQGRSGSLRPMGYSRSSSDPGVPMDQRLEARANENANPVKQETGAASDGLTKDGKEECEDTSHQRSSRKSNGGGVSSHTRSPNGNSAGGSNEKVRRDGSKHSSPRKPTEKKSLPPAPDFNMESDFPSLTSVELHALLITPRLIFLELGGRIEWRSQIGNRSMEPRNSKVTGWIDFRGTKFTRSHF